MMIILPNGYREHELKQDLEEIEAAIAQHKFVREVEDIEETFAIINFFIGLSIFLLAALTVPLFYGQF